MRYFSLCNNLYRRPWPVILNNLPGGGTDPGCRADNKTTIDVKGRFTNVVAPQSLVELVARWPGTTFVPTSTKQPHLREVLIFRNMLSNRHFRHSALDAPQNASWQGAAEAMGRYLPTRRFVPAERISAARARPLLPPGALRSDRPRRRGA